METQLPNDSPVKRFRVRPKDLRKRCLSDRTNVLSSNTRRANENGTCANDYRGEPSSTERLAEIPEQHLLTLF